MQRHNKPTNDTTDVHMPNLAGLSQTASRFVREHPQQARMAVAAALEAAAVQYEVESGGTAVEVPAALQPFVVRRARTADTLGVTQAAARLQVSRTTVYDWVERKILLGWRSTKRGLTIPHEQILGPGKVVPGMAQVLAVIDDPELAWAFLTQDWPFEDGVARPIDKLKAGEVEAVVDAAPGFGASFT